MASLLLSLRHRESISNNRSEDAAFLDELQRLADAAPSLHFVPTMTDMAKSHRGWHGETGFIDREMTGRHLPLCLDWQAV